jgi:peptidoglycan/LPS O-acetylase OafA/YrhL
VGPRRPRPLPERSVSVKLAVLLAIAPFIYLVYNIVQGQGVDYILFSVAVIVGAGADAYALGQFRRETLRYLVLCLATAGLLGALLVIGATISATGLDVSTALPTGGRLGPPSSGSNGCCSTYLSCS